MSICSAVPLLPSPSSLATAVLASGFFVHAADKRTGVVVAGGGGGVLQHRCIGALTSGGSQLGQCRAVFSSPQDPYFWWEC